MAFDEKKANVARQVALGRWGKPFNASIAAKLDEPKEWVDEASHLNGAMPPLLGSKVPDLNWQFVLPVEFANPKVTTVGVYALFVYAHLKYDHEFVEALKIAHTENAGFVDADVSEESIGQAVAFYLEMVRE